MPTCRPDNHLCTILHRRRPVTLIQTDRLDLITLTADLISDVLAGCLEAIRETAGFTVPADWPDAHDARFLRMRLEQLHTDAAADLWFVRAVVLREDPARPLIGHVGFHGPPKDNSAEMGYTIFLPHRGHGYATEAVIGLMDWARGRGVERFILSIAPSNRPSLSVARRLGFKRLARQIDEEDGLEYVFELKAI